MNDKTSEEERRPDLVRNYRPLQSAPSSRRMR
jgi:hypothetical protein